MAAKIVFVQNVVLDKIRTIDNPLDDNTDEADQVLEVSNKKVSIDYVVEVDGKTIEIDIIVNRTIDGIEKVIDRSFDPTLVLIEVEETDGDIIKIAQNTSKKEKNVEVMEKIKIRMR